ncbi:MAG: lactate utilization protein [Spirochaetia bacterium]|jgi:hypothetical protein|nr:lactate utilization protein [Spirochaetia bacterium]
MDEHNKACFKANAMETIENLKKNQITAYYVEDKQQAVQKVTSLLKAGETVSVGGSMTLFETGIIDLLRNGTYKFLDRYEKGLTKDQVNEIYRKSFYADTYLASANAVTRHGEILEVDGNGNRVAAITWGPKQVILVVGINKITQDLSSAVERVKNIATPSNTRRLKVDTFCMKHGHCISPYCDAHNLMALSAGSCPDSICSISTVFSHQLHAGRIKVIIVGEQLGY